MVVSFVLVSVLLFYFGAVIGSFLNVVIYRSLDDQPRRTGESWWRGWSRCDHCGRRIAWYDNIPLVSFLWLRGKCRSCQDRISVSHPVVELLTGALFVWWYWGGSLFFQLTKAPFQTLQPLFWLMVGMLLLIIALADLRYWIIPDWAVAALTGLTVLYRIVLVWAGVMQPLDLVATIVITAATALALGGIWWSTRQRGIGLGDVKLMIPLGLLLGWPDTVVALFLAFLTGAIVGVVLLATKRRQLGQAIPFGPFLVLASCVSLVWGDTIVSWYLSLLR